jgi:ecotin
MLTSNRHFYGHTSNANMMTQIKFLVGSICLFALLLSAMGAEHPELKAFPPAKANMDRFVIVLPHKERGEEDGFKVELIAGKMMPTDGVNLVRLGLTIEPRDLKGWGYTYYTVVGSSQAVSTLIGVPPGTPQVTRFVTGSPLQIAYNSRLPIVIYVPAGIEIRYRIWSASGEFKPADKG